MRRHVQGMRSGWSDAGIAARGRQSEFRSLRAVVAVNQVMRDARMIGFLGEELLQNGGGFLALARLLRQQCQRIKSCSLMVFRISLVYPFHRRCIQTGAFLKAAFRWAAIEGLRGG